MWTSLRCHPACFNPRTHEGCDRIVFLIKISTDSFNPRTHEGCDGTQVDHEIPIEVSIHAPTRGATARLSYSAVLQRVSIHAPTRGATDAPCYRLSRVESFNPRTHEGCDRKTSGDHCRKRVSIHAPTRGATFRHSL